MRTSSTVGDGVSAAAAGRTLATPGGGQVAVNLFEPDGAPTGVVVIGGAMGVPQSHYAPFARWLAAQGWLTVSFDYRSQGASLPLGPALRRSRATLNDWASDYEAVVAHARSLLPKGPLLLIGHSLGAQLPGMFEQTEHIDGLVAVATGIGYWRHYPARLRRTAGRRRRHLDHGGDDPGLLRAARRGARAFGGDLDRWHTRRRPLRGRPGAHVLR